MCENGLTDVQLQDARKYACCIVGETNKFKSFAIAMIDYMGKDIIPHVKTIYKELSQILFMRAIPSDDINFIDNCTESEISEWYDSYIRIQEDREREARAFFDDNIDELQFLVEECRNREDFQKMLEIVGKFSHLAPYNAMLVELQKPGCQLVLNGECWERYGRRPKPNAQQLITLFPFGPIQCMFDISDTEPIPGVPVTEDAKILELWDCTLKRIECEVPDDVYDNLIGNLPSYGVYLDDKMNAANTYGGYVMPYKHDISIPFNANMNVRHDCRFLISVNRNQSKTEKFHTICHELGHIFCRHMSYDLTKTRHLSCKEEEFEAETVAWLMCKRHGIKNPSEEYLATYAPNGIIPICSKEFIMKSVTEIERMVKGNVYAKKSMWYREDRYYKKFLDSIHI